METRYRIETYTVAVPVPTSTTSNAPTTPTTPTSLQTIQYNGTQPDVAKAVMKLLQPSPGDVVVDLGCGEGELLVAANSYGARLVGVELDPNRALKAQKRVPEAKIILGDMLKQRYESGTIYICYLFPDLIADVAPMLPSGAILASIDHDVPGLDLHETKFRVDSKQYSLYTGRIK